MPPDNPRTAQDFSVSARDLGVKYLVRYQHEEMTLRSTFTQALVKKLSSAGAAGARREAVWALSDVSFQLRTGEIAALIGPNGSGKTTLLKTLAGILAPDHGEVSTVGQVGCLLTFGVGFNAHLTGRENILFSGSMLGIKNEKLEACTHDIIELSELGDFIDAPVRSYSSGMRIRLGFAISIHIAPDVLLLDEMLSAGDAAFSAKSGTVLEHLAEDERTILLATHNMDMVRELCTRAIWLEAGEIRMDGPAPEVCDAYLDATRRKAEMPKNEIRPSTGNGSA